jgi:hypothetical protein
VTNELRTAPSAWLALLVFADGFFVVLFALHDYSPWALLGAVLAGLPLAGSIWSRRWDLPWFGPAAGLLLSFGLAAVQGFQGGSLGDDVLGGVLLGSPLAIMAAILRWSREPAVLVPATFAGLVDLLTLNAALNRLAAQGAVATPVALANTFVQVSGDQLNGFSGLLAGNVSVTLPVQSLRDPVFAGLALLAIVGVFLALFASEPSGDRSVRAGASGIFVPVGIAVLAAALFELAAGQAPRFALLGLAVAVLGTVVAILVLVRWNLPVPTRGPATSSSAAPSGPAHRGPPSEAVRS